MAANRPVGPRLKLVLPYLVLVAVAAVFIARRDDLELRAALRMPRNHRVRRSDVGVPAAASRLGAHAQPARGIEGRYLTRAVYKDEAIMPADLSERPIIEDMPGTSVKWLSLGELGLRPGSLDVDDLVSVCGDLESDEGCVPGRVVAERCGNEESHCEIGIRTRVDEGSVERIVADSPRLVVRRPNGKGEAIVQWNKPIDVEVNAKPDGLWTLAIDYLTGPAFIKIEAKEGTWWYTAGQECSADGDLASLVAAKTCILANAPVGALIAKIGGSTAGTADGTMILIGRSCTFEIAEAQRGPLYLTINDQPNGLADNRGKLTALISIAAGPTPN